MATVEARRYFLVYIVEEEVGLNHLLNDAIHIAGFRTKTFLSAEAALDELKNEPPHIIVSAARLPSISGRELLEKVRALSSEIETILIEDGRDPVVTVHNLKAGAYAVIKKPLAQMAEVVSTVDRAAEKLFLQFKNERLTAEVKRKTEIIENLDNRLKDREQEPFFLQRMTETLAGLQDPQMLVEAFIESFRDLAGGNAPVIWFRHASSYMSIVFGAGSGIAAAQFRGVGLDFRQTDSKDYPAILLTPERIESFKEMMTSVFTADRYSCWPLKAGDETAGFFVVFEDHFDSARRTKMEMALKVLSLHYERVLLEKRFHDTANKDALTGLLNRRGLTERLEEEISRSRRNKTPLAVIRADMDHFSFYRQANGQGAAEALLKALASVIRRASRRYDVAGYLGDDEFVLVLPETDQAGAAIKAERLRRMIELAKFSFRERQPAGAVTMSFGISEYPSLASDADGLLQSAAVALDRMKKGGRNRVCVAQASKGMEPDFSIRDPGNISEGIVDLI